jgi:hypothetical protein
LIGCQAENSYHDATAQVSGGNKGAEQISQLSEAVACGECFAIEKLPLHLQEYAAELLLKALDSEALYSVLSDVKPMSSGWASLTFPEGAALPLDLVELQQIADVFNCGSGITAEVQIFNGVYEGTRYADAIFFRTSAFKKAIEVYSNTFSAIGVHASDMDPLSVVNIVDADPTTDRFRAYGHLFGYPDHAVKFFAEAEENELNGGGFVEREFINIPTFAAEEGAFVYAVPKGHSLNAADVELANRAKPVLKAYKHARNSYATTGSAWAIAMVRDVFRQADGMCSVAGADSYVSIHGK